ncbi:hypothetical protein Tco_0299945 [Tanacetum coccineum]
MLLNLDQLEQQLDKEEFQETGSMDAFRVLKTQFQRFINFRYYFDDDEGLMIHKYFLAYTRIEVRQFRDTLFQHMESLQESIQERAKHKREYDIRINDKMMQSKEGKVDSSKALDAALVVTENNETKSESHVSSSRSGKHTHAEDGDINSVNDKQPIAEVQLTAEHDIPTNEQQHYEQSESIYDTYLLEKVDRNTTPDSTDMSHMEGEIDQNVVKKRSSEKDRNSKTSVMPSAKSQNTTKSCKSKPRSNNQTSRVLPTSKSSCPTITAMPKAYHSRNSNPFSDFKHFVCSTCQKCVFSATHDVCITKFLKEVNSRVKIQSPKTRDSTKPVEPTSHTQKPSRQIVTGHRFSPNKSSAVHEKTNTPRSCLRWIPTGRIFNTAGLRWVPTGKKFTSSTTKVDCEPLNGSNKDITNPYECNQTLNVSAGTLNLSAGTSFNPNKERLRVWLLKKLMSKNQVPQGIHKQKQFSRVILLYVHKMITRTMASVDNTSGPVPQRKERCTLQCALSSKAEKSSCFRPFSSTMICSHMLGYYSSGSTYINLYFSSLG